MVRLEICSKKVHSTLKVYLVVILKLSLGSRICGEKIVVILQCLIGKKGEARGQSKNKQIFQYFITMSAKDASFNKKWILGSVLEVLIDFFFSTVASK